MKCWLAKCQGSGLEDRDQQFLYILSDACIVLMRTDDDDDDDDDDDTECGGRAS